jgi:hypothetical protein
MKNIENSLSNVSKTAVSLEVDAICPSCFMPKTSSDLECNQCGIVFSQYYKWAKEKKVKHTISGLYHLSNNDIDALEASWKKIENVYLDQTTHEQFIHLCLRLKSLPFAAHKYNERVRLFPEDDIARHQLEKVIALANEWFGTAEEADPVLGSPTLWRLLIAFSGFAICASIFSLFVGMTSSTPAYYLWFGTFATIASMAIFVAGRKLYSGKL